MCFFQSLELDDFFSAQKAFLLCLKGLFSKSQYSSFYRSLYVFEASIRTVTPYLFTSQLNYHSLNIRVMKTVNLNHTVPAAFVSLMTTPDLRHSLCGTTGYSSAQHPSVNTTFIYSFNYVLIFRLLPRIRQLNDTVFLLTKLKTTNIEPPLPLLSLYSPHSELILREF